MTPRGGEEGQESGGQDLRAQVVEGTEGLLWEGFYPSSSKLCGPSQALCILPSFSLKPPC